MAILKKIYPLFLPALLAGCTEDFPIDVEIIPVLCVNSTVTCGEPVEISLSHTWLYTDEEGEEHHSVDDAALSVYVNGSVADSGWLPREGDEIRIVADSPKYGHAESEVTVPVSAGIVALDWMAEVTGVHDWTWDPDELSSTVYGLKLRAKVTIRDTADSDNYYHLVYRGFPAQSSQVEHPVWVYIGTFRHEIEPIFTEHIGLTDEMLYDSDSGGYTIFTDRQFPEGEYTLNLQFEDIWVVVREDVDIDDMPDVGIRFIVETVSESYYNWSVYRWNMDSGMIGQLIYFGLGNPVCGYSNVTSGAGVVSAISPASCEVSFRDILKDATPAAPQ